MKLNAKRFSLRELTREQHEELDASVGDLEDVHAYRRYLLGMAAFRKVVETPLTGMVLPTEFGAWRPTFIARKLTEDLDDLGLVEPAALPPFDMPRDVSGLLGVSYVLEGSALGARLLAKRAAALGFDAGRGARHLAAQTARPESWGHFQAMLEDVSFFDVNAAARSARETFAAAIRAFSKVDVCERAS